MVRDGQQATVRALTRMPGVADGEIRHLPWEPALAVLVDAGRYELLEAAPPDAAPGRNREDSAVESGTARSGARSEGGGTRTGRSVDEPAGPARNRTGRSR